MKGLCPECETIHFAAEACPLRVDDLVRRLGAAAQLLEAARNGNADSALAACCQTGLEACREAQDAMRAIPEALHHLDGATPRQRNGPVYQAADTLREIIGLPPMKIGSQPSDGLPL